MNKFDYTKLRGADLFDYITLTSDFEDSDLKSDVELLAYALIPTDKDQSKTYRLTERLVNNEIELIAYYPGVDNMDTSTMTKIGDIMDGYLFYRPL